jgi:hypothetical protein
LVEAGSNKGALGVVFVVLLSGWLLCALLIILIWPALR